MRVAIAAKMCADSVLPRTAHAPVYSFGWSSHVAANVQTCICFFSSSAIQQVLVLGLRDEMLLHFFHLLA